MAKVGILTVSGTEYVLNLGETYFVGIKSKSFSHDIEVDDASVDIKHCIFDFTERLPKVIDLRSKFGTFVDGVRVAVCQMIPLVKSTTIQFGNVEATFQALSKNDSQYLEGQLPLLHKDTSESIRNNPEHVESSGNRPECILTGSINPTTTNIKDISKLLIPIKIPLSKISLKNVNGFHISETPIPVDVSINKNQCKNRSTNIFAQDTQWTQVLGKSASISNSIIKLPVPPIKKENMSPEKDDLFLPSAPYFSSLLRPPTPFRDEDPPSTRVFPIEGPAPTTTSCFPSTLLEDGMQLFENSFREMCNKFLDSDDDEMDEVIAPELVKKMQKSTNQFHAVTETPKTIIENTTDNERKIIKQEEALKENQNLTLTYECGVSPKPSTIKSSAINIDNFQLTPDFVENAFPKDRELQELAELNWNKKLDLETSKKECKSLLTPNSYESDGSQDSFCDLLPKKTWLANKIDPRPEIKKTNAPDKQEAEGKITRRRKSMFEEESINKKVPRKTDVTLIQLESDKKEKKDSSTKKVMSTHLDREEIQNDHKQPKARPNSGMSEKPSKVSSNTLHQSSKELYQEIAKSKHKSNSHSHSNSFRRKSSDSDTDWIGLTQKTIKKCEMISKDAANLECPVKPVTQLSKTHDVVLNNHTMSTGLNNCTTSKSYSANQKPESTSSSTAQIVFEHIAKQTTTESNKTTDSSSKRRENEPLVKPLRHNFSSTDEIKRERPKIAVTMCDPSYVKTLEQHSGKCWLYTNEPKNCDIMVAAQGTRSYKMLIAIARGIPVVHLDWLEEVLRRDSVDIPIEKYIFEDKKFQIRYKFKMRKTLHLAKTTVLLKGLSFIITPGVRPVPKEMKDIIICAGGTVLDSVPQSQKDNTIYLILQEKDEKLWRWHRWINPNIKVVLCDSVLTSIMQQSKNALKSIV